MIFSANRSHSCLGSKASVSPVCWVIILTSVLFLTIIFNQPYLGIHDNRKDSEIAGPINIVKYVT